MKLRIALTISLGRDRPSADGADETGSHHEVGPVDLSLGLTGPGPKTDQAWEARR